MDFLHSPFTAVERDEDDERHELQRTGTANVPAAVFIVLALPFVVALGIFFIRF